MRKPAFALLAGVIVFVVLFPWGGGLDSFPPTCFGMFGLYTVPCGGWPAVATGALTAAIGALALWILAAVERARGASVLRTVGMAALAGFAVFIILVPTSGADTLCVSLLAFMGFGVPCEGIAAQVGGVATAVLVALAGWPRREVDGVVRTA